MDQTEKDKKLAELEQQMIQEENRVRSSGTLANILPFLAIGLTANHDFLYEPSFRMPFGKPERGKIIHSGDTPRIHKRIGRNNLCPCDSNQKFKNCHGR